MMYCAGEAVHCAVPCRTLNKRRCALHRMDEKQMSTIISIEAEDGEMKRFEQEKMRDKMKSM